jgi:hypothetical protein
VIDGDVIKFVGDRVHKRYVSDVVGEFAKARALWEISEHFGFVCPEPIELREAESVIVYRNLGVYGSWEPIKSVYLEYMTGSAPSEVAAGPFAEAGRVLGAIHANLELECSVPWTPDDEFCKSLERVDAGGSTPNLELDPQVYLHGDYGFSNVWWSEDTLTIATFDPSPDGYSTFAARIHGPAYVDLGQFSSCLEGRVPLSWHPRLKWGRLDGLRRTFLDAYEAEAAVAIDIDVVRRFGFAIVEANLRDRLSYRLAQRLGSMVMFNRLKKNVL